MRQLTGRAADGCPCCCRCRCWAGVARAAAEPLCLPSAQPGVSDLYTHAARHAAGSVVGRRKPDRNSALQFTTPSDQVLDLAAAHFSYARFCARGRTSGIKACLTHFYSRGLRVLFQSNPGLLQERSFGRSLWSAQAQESSLQRGNPEIASCNLAMTCHDLVQGTTHANNICACNTPMPPPPAACISPAKPSTYRQSL